MSKLYHYTKEAGMDGIFHKRNLWVSMTSKPEVNDPFDTVYIKQMIDRLLKKTNDYFQKLALEIMRDVLNPPTEEKTKEYIKNYIFIFCVNEEENDDFMVKEFGPKKIVFDKDQLIKQFQTLVDQRVYFKEFDHRKVNYNEVEQEAMIMDLIKEAKKYFIYGEVPDYSYLSSTPTTVDSGNEIDIDLLLKKLKLSGKSAQYKKEFLGIFWTALANRFYFLAPFIKNPDHKKEREYRFAFYRGRDVLEYVPLIDNNTRLELSLNNECMIECIELR
ncbi:hypothetical protein JI735_19700 [Paenibacillus sonchi]|uniref:Uncharacterized protein n=1 Tax=Paenibacillus sonchi TaxID=373687 RepID=A0A974P7Q6_9BACL|nr:hypothetical protein [Paenibacillus sonchi]QQZ58954.1 hypothetical protein JI735_19700 [Paenibacillus sonchi]